jgi:hypothetical protein
VSLMQPHPGVEEISVDPFVLVCDSSKLSPVIKTWPLCSLPRAIAEQERFDGHQSTTCRGNFSAPSLQVLMDW